MFNQEEVIISQLACLRKKEDRNYRGLWFYLLILGISKVRFEGNHVIWSWNPLYSFILPGAIDELELCIVFNSHELEMFTRIADFQIMLPFESLLRILRIVRNYSMGTVYSFFLNLG